MKFIIDGTDKEMGHIIMETKNMPREFMHQMQPIYENGMLSGFVIQFCMPDKAEGQARRPEVGDE